jgi:hypothetical protein
VKEDITTMASVDSLDIIKQLRLCSYNHCEYFREAASLENRRYLGFLAQEVQEVLPQCVGSRDNRFKGPTGMKIEKRIEKQKVKRMEKRMVDTIEFGVSGIETVVKKEEDYEIDEEIDVEIDVEIDTFDPLLDLDLHELLLHSINAIKELSEQVEMLKKRGA